MEKISFPGRGGSNLGGEISITTQRGKHSLVGGGEGRRTSVWWEPGSGAACSASTSHVTRHTSHVTRVGSDSPAEWLLLHKQGSSVGAWTCQRRCSRCKSSQNWVTKIIDLAFVKANNVFVFSNFWGQYAYLLTVTRRLFVCVSSWLSLPQCSRMLTTRASRWQTKKTATTQKSSVARPISRAWDLGQECVTPPGRTRSPGDAGADGGRSPDLPSQDQTWFAKFIPLVLYFRKVNKIVETVAGGE